MLVPVTPLLAADIIIELVDRPGRPIVLIERRNPPPGWAIPGGFVDVGESIEQAAVREAREETALEVRLTALLGVYSDPKRDARGHTASVVYVATARGTPRAQDDAASGRRARRRPRPCVRSARERTGWRVRPRGGRLSPVVRARGSALCRRWTRMFLSAPAEARRR